MRGILFAAAAGAVTACVAVAETGPSEVKASSFGWNATNATRCLQAALDSKAKRVVVDKQVSSWLVEPLQLRSNQEVVFENGVVVEAVPDGFKGRNDALFTARSVRNVSLSGLGRAVLRMRKADYQDETRYLPAEWRNVLSIHGSSNLSVSNLSLVASGGDGVYIAHGRNISLDGLTVCDNHRQGVSVISVDGLVIRNSTFALTDGVPPYAGIDFEPNEARECLVNVLVENCVFSGNRGAGIEFHLTMLRDGISRPVSVVVRNCRSFGNEIYGLKVCAGFDCPIKGTLRFENCDFSGNGKYGLYLVNQYAGHIKIAFDRCRFDARGASEAAVFVDNNSKFDPFGGLSFRDVSLVTDADRRLSFAQLPGSGVEDLAGDVELVMDGKRERMPFAAFVGSHVRNPALDCFRARSCDLAALRPLDPAARGAGGRCPWLRGNFRFVQYVPAAGTYPITFRCQAVGRAAPRSDITVTGPDGRRLPGFRSTRVEGDVYELKADAPGVYVFDVMTYGHVVSVDSPFPGQGLDATQSLTPMHWGTKSRPQKYYFRVPSGTKTVAVAVVPAKNEPVATRLVAPDGSVAAVGNLSAVAYPVFAARTNPDVAETWCVEFTKVAEDMSFSIGAPASPIVATDPALVFEAQGVAK